MQKITYQPIGIVHTSFSTAGGMPIQPSGDAAARGTVELLSEYSAGLVPFAQCFTIGKLDLSCYNKRAE